MFWMFFVTPHKTVILSGAAPLRMTVLWDLGQGDPRTPAAALKRVILDEGVPS
jgi:hypothetical protein